MNIINTAIKWEIPLQRWKVTVNRLIPKEPGKRLRVIHLYEADLSILCAVHWRKILHLLEDAQILNDRTYGSRPRQSSTIPPFIEDMQNNISCMTRKPLIKFDNDATSCYDRILVPVASLACRSNSLPKKIAAVWATNLQEALYKLKITHEVSDTFYHHSTETPVHGSG